MKLQPYPAYKDSGVEWLGQIPAHWDMRRIDRLFRLRNEPPQAGDERVTGYLDGRVTLRSNVARQKIKGVIKDAGWQRIHTGDFAISGMNAHLGGMGVSDSLGQCSPIYLVMEPRADTNAEYVSHAVRYIAHTGVLKTLVNTIRFNSADFKRDDLKQIRVWLPSQEEQKQIVRFISQLTIRTNRLIKAKRRLIELLHEQKQAVIHRAVTMGLDPDAPRKPSGVDWLGDIPAHWSLSKLGRHIDLLTGFPFNSESFSSHSSDIKLLRGINIAPGAIRWDAVVRWSILDKDLYSTFALQVGDVVLGMDRPIIREGMRVAIIKDDDTPCLLLQRVARIRPLKQLDNNYLITLLSGRSFAEYLRPIFTGISVPHISPEQIRSFPTALPPLHEQRHTIERLQHDMQTLDEAVQRARREIELIREYRTRLIADVVTGKIDVRGAVLPVSDTAAEWESMEPDDEDADALNEAEEATDEGATG